MESPLITFLAILSLFLLGGVEARKYPEDMSNSIAEMRAKQAAMVESADSKVNDQASTLTITVEKSCGGAEVDKGKINLSPFQVEMRDKKEAGGSVYIDQNKPKEEKFSFVFDPRTDATIYHE